LRFERGAFTFLMTDLATSIASPVVAASLRATSTSLIDSTAVTASISSTASKVSASTATSKTTSVILAATKIASSAKTTSSAESTTAIAPRAPASHHATANVASVLERSTLPNNLLKVVRSCKWLIHAEILVFIVAVLETTTLVFHGMIVGGYVDVPSRTSRYRLRLFWLRLVVVLLPSPLLSLLLAFVLGFFFVVRKLNIISLFIVEV
jgi:hypothetical protein